MGLTQTKEPERSAATSPSDDQRGVASMPERVPTPSVKLSALLAGVESSVSPAAGELEIRQVTCDSRKVQPGAFFFALHGAKADGNAFISDAVSSRRGGHRQRRGRAGNDSFQRGMAASARSAQGIGNYRREFLWASRGSAAAGRR